MLVSNVAALRFVSYASSLLSGVLFSQNLFVMFIILSGFSVFMFLEWVDIFTKIPRAVKILLGCVFVVLCVFRPTQIQSLLSILFFWGFAKLCTWSYKIGIVALILGIVGETFAWIDMRMLAFYSTLILLLTR